MLLDDHSLTPSVIIAAARSVLTKNGFRISEDRTALDINNSYLLLAEDEYSVLALAAYETWAELEEEWSVLQGELVALLSRRLARSSPKAWDGYVVLFCPTAVPDRAAVGAIERDTSRVRKIVAAGDALRTTKDVERILDPFLPLDLPPGQAQLQEVLDTLPELLKEEVSVAATQAVVDAFRAMEPPLQRLHDLGELE
jgi:hypothetical protein